MTKHLNICWAADDLRLPLDAVTQTFAILAKRRVGKTYTASVMAEEFVAAGLPFVALDPTGAWWGLRAAADGKSEGLPVVIIGGAHGDVPLEPTAGKVIADLVVSHPGFYVIDLSETASNAEQDRFATEFSERLYRQKEKHRDPLHLFIDEADSFAPQRPMPGQQRMLGAFEALVRRGGIRGIGATFITQRPAVLNKNILTQTECLIALQTTAPQDQDAIDDWVKRNGTKDERDTLMASLASLQTGEAWFWSPAWLKIFQKVRIRSRETFNSSATPKAGEKAVVPQKLAKVDLEKLGEEIHSTIERAKENDPAELRRTITDLKRKVADLEQKGPQEVPVPIFDAASRQLLEHVQSTCDRLLQESKARANDIEEINRWLIGAAARAANLQNDYFRQQSGSIPRPLAEGRGHASPAPAPGPAGGTNGFELSKCQRAILKVLAGFPNGKSKSGVAVIAGYAHNGGGFNNSVSSLRVAGLIEGSDPLRITPEGVATIGPVERPMSGEEMYGYWMEHPDLGRAEREILRVLWESGGRSMTKDTIAGLTISDRGTNYEAGGGGFSNAMSRLRTYELIEGRSDIRLAKEFFE